MATTTGVAQFVATDGVNPPKASADVVVARRIKNDRFEVVYGDGRVVWNYVGGGGYGIEYPPGFGKPNEQYLFQEIPGAPPPPLPTNLIGWGEELEKQALSIIDTFLPGSDQAGYRALFKDKDYPDRMVAHLKAIRHLAGE